jgi:hypothetical protein
VQNSRYGGYRDWRRIIAQIAVMLSAGRIPIAIGRNDEQHSVRNRSPNGSRRNVAMSMLIKKLGVGLMLLSLGLILGSCSSVSAVVSDYYPHWAGGEPKDTPPRPGEPGYAEFIAHKSPDNNAANPTNSADKTNPQAASSGNSPPAGPAVTEGGLY